MTITAAADGSALGNPGPAGWAWYVDEDHWHAGGWPHGTNNQGELMAVLDLFRSTVHMADEPLRILCDSQYVINCITKWMPGWKRRGWKKADGKPVLNVDLLAQIDAELAGRDYTFEWVRGHAGHALNEAADAKARAVALAFQSGRAPGEGPGFGVPLVSAAAPGTAGAPGPAGQPDRPASEQASLFDEIAPEAAEAGQPRDLDAVVELEQSLLNPDVRTDYGQLAYLLHPDFQEIGASGRLWDREELIEELVQRGGQAPRFELLDAVPLADDLIHIVYRTVAETASELRSSLWQRTEGRWRVRFHQGTPEA
ncbi:ribonuclease HI family protein [Sinomonas notoginsengisoli]|uniref:ribonuclease HI family protein n=1 Tax=Sinomonas notoginsengisoli TaxID=1457311 RepID=UPI001F40D25C|nr:ribonuclease HI family protein [Sinomonas notoginsengisoli]